MERERIIQILDMQEGRDAPEAIEVTTRGVLEGDEDDYTLRYTEYFGDGLSSNTTIRVTGGKRVCILRTGDIDTELVVEEGRRHQSVYDTPFGSMTVGVYANAVHSAVIASGGELFMEYTVDIDGMFHEKKKMRVSVGGVIARRPQGERKMKNTVKTAEAQILTLVSAAIRAAIRDGALPEAELVPFKVEVPADKQNGDYATNAAMAHARAFRMPPMRIAGAILERLDLQGSYFSHCEAAGAGFLNFTLAPSFYADVLCEVKEAGENYGHIDLYTGKRALVEFVSANPTGPMHVGNARGGAIGDSLAELLTWAGYETEREFYINDGGNQIEKFGLSLDIRYRQHFGDPVEMPEDSYHGQDIVEHAEKFAELYGDRYLGVPEAERRRALVEYALPLNIAGLERDLLKYKIRYDTWFRESALHESGAAKAVVELLTARGYTYEQDGALWFRAEQFGCDKDFVLRRSNGFYTYIVPDIAYHYNKLCIRNFDIAIDVLGADHHGYVPRLKAALTALGIDADRLKIVLMQMVNLMQDGKPVKLSKRSGKAITLVTLLDEMPIDAARFFFNLREANTHCDIDLELAVEQSAQNPVYYCQYAHARICSIFRKLEANGYAYGGFTPEQALLLEEPEERELIRFIAALPAETETGARELDPSRMTRYAVELATLFHKFYNACRCDVQNADLKAARLGLCACTRTVLANVLGLLKVDAPSEM